MGGIVKPKRGFTLIELLIVVVILGIMAAVVTPQISAGMSGSKLATASRSVIQAYEIRNGRYPDSLDDLTVATDSHPAYLKKDSLNDSWGNAFQYKKTGKFEFEIRSAGEDGQMNTDDDITN